MPSLYTVGEQSLPILYTPGLCARQRPMVQIIETKWGNHRERERDRAFDRPF